MRIALQITLLFSLAFVPAANALTICGFNVLKKGPNETWTASQMLDQSGEVDTITFADGITYEVQSYSKEGNPVLAVPVKAPQFETATLQGGVYKRTIEQVPAANEVFVIPRERNPNQEKLNELSKKDLTKHTRNNPISTLMALPNQLQVFNGHHRYYAAWKKARRQKEDIVVHIELLPMFTNFIQNPQTWSEYEQ